MESTGQEMITVVLDKFIFNISVSAVLPNFQASNFRDIFNSLPRGTHSIIDATLIISF